MRTINRKYTLKTIKKDINKIHKYSKVPVKILTPISQIKNSSSRVQYKCGECGNTNLFSKLNGIEYRCKTRHRPSCYICSRQIKSLRNNNQHMKWFNNSMNKNDILNEINKRYFHTVKVLSNIKGLYHVIRCEHLICGFKDWYTTPYLLLGYRRRRKCPYCKKYINKEMKHKLYILFKIHNRYPYINIIGKINGAESNTKFYCKRCRRKWITTPREVYLHGCIKCNRKRNSEILSKAHMMNSTDILNRIENKWNYSVVNMSKINGMYNKVHWTCLRCGYDWWDSPRNLCRKKYPICKHCLKILNDKKAIRKLHKLMSSHLRIVVPIIHHKRIWTGHKGDYYRRIRTILVQCKKCKFKFFANVNQLYKGQECPKCNATHLEHITWNMLNRLGLKAKHNDFTHGYIFHGGILDKYHLDFRISNKFSKDNNDIAIECQGIQHYMPCEFFGGVDSYYQLHQRDMQKVKYCLPKYHIHLIHVSTLTLTKTCPTLRESTVHVFKQLRNKLFPLLK